MNKRAMESLAKFIEKLPKGKFDVTNWVSLPFSESLIDDDADDTLLNKKGLLNICGTACCIAGAQVIRRGFSLNLDGVVIDKNGEQVGWAWDVAKEQLDLDNAQETNLFYPGGWPIRKNGSNRFPFTNKGAAARIRFMIKTGE